MRMNKRQQLIELLKELHLPMFREYHQEFAQKATADELSYEAYLYELAQRECEVRRANKIARLVKASKLPLEKTLQTFELKRLPLKIRRQAIDRLVHHSVIVELNVSSYRAEQARKRKDKDR